jgi:hypothetical protein
MGLQSRQQRVVRRPVPRRDADGATKSESKILKIAEMVVDLRGDDARLGVGTIERLGLRGAVLNPQRNADQDEKRNRGGRHEPEQLRAYSQMSRHRDYSGRSGLKPQPRCGSSKKMKDDGF